MTTYKTPKFRNKNGSLTAYSFACGYLETFTPKGEDFYTVRLYRDDVYHVQGNISGEYFWESFNTLTEARKLFKQLTK
jgi:hypothetical protein